VCNHTIASNDKTSHIVTNLAGTFASGLPWHRLPIHLPNIDTAAIDYQGRAMS